MYYFRIQALKSCDFRTGAAKVYFVYYFCDECSENSPAKVFFSREDGGFRNKNFRQPSHTYIHTHTYIHIIYIYIYPSPCLYISARVCLQIANLAFGTRNQNRGHRAAPSALPLALCGHSTSLPGEEAQVSPDPWTRNQESLRDEEAPSRLKCHSSALGFGLGCGGSL